MRRVGVKLGENRGSSKIKYLLVIKPTFIAENSLAISKYQHEKAREAAFVTVLMRLASQSETTVIAAGCSAHTIRDLQELLKGGGFRLIRLARLEIDKLIREFLTAISATGSSV